MILIFVIPGWLVHNYEILTYPVKKVNGVCPAYSDDGDCYEFNPWYASEVY
jgi:hypothetical protein